MSQNVSEASQAEPSPREQEALELQARMEGIGRKLLVLSGKGGVGKSTIAANLAVSLARAGQKVGLLDVDLHGPSIPKILGLEGQRLGPDAAGGIAPIQVGTNLLVVSVGLLLDSARDAVIWRGPMKYNVIRQFLKDVQWGRLDCLVIDSPPGTGDEPLAVAQMVGTDAWAVVVTTPQDVAIADVRRSVSFCKTLNLRVAGVIENMSGLVCPRCGQRVELFKAGGGAKLADEMNVPFLGSIPLDPQIVVSGDAGKPLIQQPHETQGARAFREVAEAVARSTGIVLSGSLGQTTPTAAPDGEISKAPDNPDDADPFAGRMNDPSGSAFVRGICGDEMEFYLEIDDRQTITRARYWTTNGCQDARLCGRAVAERVQGLSVWDALAISPRLIIDAQPELASGGRHCAILAITTLYRAIADYLLKP